MPDWKPEIRKRLAGLRLAPTREAAIVEELAQHLEDYYAELLAGGATTAEATRLVRAELNESELLQRELRRVERQVALEPIILGTNRRINMIADLWQDLRYGARMLIKKPGFTLIAVLTLALGIGANTAIFSVVNGALLKPLPYPASQQLVRLFERVERTTMASDRMEVAPANFLDWREQSTSFSGLATYGLTGLALSADGRAERIEGALASADFFSVMGAQPLLGRTFTAEDERGGYRFLAVISFDLWQRRFGGAREIVGRAIQLDGFSFTVIGVMPPGFGYPHRTELWELYRLNANQRQMREARFRVEPGIDVERLLAVEFEPPSARYNGSDWKAQRFNFWQQLSAHVAVLPGVEAVGAVDSLPFSSSGTRVWRFRHAGDDPNVAAGPAATFQVATRDYFRTVGIQLRRGRFFSSADGDGAPPVVIVNETMARRFWPNAEAIGQRIVIRNETFAREIVGVTSDVKHFGLERETAPEMYVPFEQFVIDVMPLLVRVKGDPAQISNAIRAQVQAVDPTVAVAAIMPMRQLLSASLAPRRFTLLLLGAFAGLALLLATGGIYGVMAYAVAERTREVGIRLALGAQTRDVLRLVVAQGMKLALGGVLVGLGGAWLLTRWLSSLLFEVSATDPLTFGAVALLLAGIALLACWLPARRATKVDPLVALKCE